MTTIDLLIIWIVCGILTFVSAITSGDYIEFLFGVMLVVGQF